MVNHLSRLRVRVRAVGISLLALALFGGCDMSQFSTAQSSTGTDVLSTLAQDILHGIGTGLDNLAQVLVLRLFA